MNRTLSNLKAPVAVFIVGTVGALLAGAPEAIVLVVVLSALGYHINKEGN